jgi:hypothetical protein
MIPLFLFISSALTLANVITFLRMDAYAKDEYWRGFHYGTEIGMSVSEKPERNHVRLPIMITRDMRQQLYDLRYTKVQVDKMTPIQASLILNP